MFSKIRDLHNFAGTISDLD